MGQFGDTIVALPAIWAIRRHFANAHLALLCEDPPKKGMVTARDLLTGAGIFAEFKLYPWSIFQTASWARKLWEQLKLLAWIRRGRFHTLIYLVPSKRSPAQIRRDKTFFRLAGIRDFIGMGALESEGGDGPTGIELSECEKLLKRLKLSGVVVPEPGKECFELGLGQNEEDTLNAWLATAPPFHAKPWIAVCPQARIAVKVWPAERYEAVVAALIKEFDIWPVVVGGPLDRHAGESLIKQWGRGYNLAGVLGPRGDAAALRRCVIYLGADTGSMHLAAAVGVPCVAVFSASVSSRSWRPYGDDNIVFQTQIACAGCGRTVCDDRRTECLLRITVDDVLAACRKMLMARGVISS
jgi:ADP-heptose:LPS heptosyltransferase